MATAPDNPTSPSSLLRGKLRSTRSGTFQVSDSLSDIDDAGVSVVESGPADTTTFINRRLELGDEVLGNNKANGTIGGSVDFLKDEKNQMTWGRRIALALIDQPWYNPGAAASGSSADYSLAAVATSNSVTLGTNGDCNRQNDEHIVNQDDECILETERTRQSMNTYNETHRSKQDDFDKNINNTEPNLAKSWAYFEHVAYVLPYHFEFLVSSVLKHLSLCDLIFILNFLAPSTWISLQALPLHRTTGRVE